MSARDVIEHALRAYYVDSAEPAAIARDLLAQYDAERDAEQGKSSPAGADATPDKVAAREARLTQLLETIRTHGGKWSTGGVQQIRRATGGPSLRGTARRDLAELHRRGHLQQHGAGNDRYYTLRTKASAS